MKIAIAEGYEEIFRLLSRENADPNLPCGKFDAISLYLRDILF
jgi:hypothetical protein